jgi:hypothetical protein
VWPSATTGTRAWGTRVTRTLWVALFAGHLAWTVHLLLSYLVAALACSSGGGWSPVPLHLTTVSALAVAAAGLAAGGAAAREREAPERRFVGRFALALGAVFLFAIVLAGGAGLFLLPCA